MCSRPSMAVSSLPLHAGDPFSSFSIQVLSKLVNWEKSETIYKRIQTTDQYHPLCNFLKDQTDKQYLIAILRDFFNLRKLKKILLSSADKCSKSVFPMLYWNWRCQCSAINFQLLSNLKASSTRMVSRCETSFLEINKVTSFFNINLKNILYVDSLSLVYKRRSGRLNVD